MVETIGLLAPPANTPIAAPRVRPTGRINLNPRQEQAIKAQEEELARIKQLKSLNSRYSNPRNPELVRDIAAQQELGRNSTAAADYVTQIGMERRKEEIQRGLLDVDQPNGLAGKAADVGADLARDQNTIGSLSGLLGDLDYKGILNQLVKTFQRPEMLTPGVNALTSFGMSGAALNQAEMAGAAAEQERMDKLAGAEQVRADKFAIARINNAPGAPEFDKTQTDLLLDITKGQGALDNLQKALELSLKSKLTGAGPQGIQGVSNLLAAFGIDPGVSDIKNYENRVARIKADLSASRIFGREMNRQELKILEKLVSDPGIFNTNTQLRNQLRSLTGSLEKTIGTKRRIIAAQFPNANIREIIEPPKSVFKE